MKKTLLFSVVLIFLALLFVNCGDNTTTQPTTNRFAFLREAAAGSEGPMQPMLGGFQGSNFAVSTIKDTSTGKPVTADFHSIILSKDGKKATFDMWPSSSSYGRALRSASDYWADIYVANVDGSSLVQITHNETYVAHPSFSPDGSKVIFLASNSTSPWDTMIANVDGTNMTDLTADSPVCHHEAMFSPDGTKIVFAGHGDFGAMDIYVMKADGTSAVNLTNEQSGNVENLLPTFSPDGSKISFTKVTYGEGTTADVYVMNADGSSVSRLTTGGVDGYSRYVGKLITFNSNRDGNLEIYKMGLDGTNQTRLTKNSIFDGFSADVFDYGTSRTRSMTRQRFHAEEQH